MTKKTLFAQKKNSKTTWEKHVNYAGRYCVFHAKKIRVIFQPAFSPV